jgi:biopolymer transport protein ExbD
VAGPIGEALVMTALGLAVAIPAVLGYNALVRGNKGMLQKFNRFAHDLHAYFVTGARVSNETQTIQPETVRLTVDAQGIYYLNDVKVEDGDLAPRFRAAAAQDPQPALHICGDRASRYERVAQAMAAAQQAGLRKIGFVTEPVQ